MESTKTRLIVIAISVCLFAVGMATFLNYFKYRDTAERIVRERLVVIGKSIENSIQASLAVGLSFSDLDMLPSLMERESAAETLILGIKIFDPTGKPLYSTDRLRSARNAPLAWVDAAQRAGGANWFAGQGDDSAVGIAIKNNFGLTEGYLALRYSRTEIDRAAQAVRNEMLLAALSIFAVTAALATIGLAILTGRIGRDVDAVEKILQLPLDESPSNSPDTPTSPSSGSVFTQFFTMARAAETELAAIRRMLQRQVAE